MLLAELEVHHSRPIAPTRRIALGRCMLPCDDPPGPGGLLLGAVAARFSDPEDLELHADLLALTHQLEAGRSIAQPRLRHRFQVDRVGLTRSVHRLHRHDDGEMVATFTDAKGSAVQHVLAAVYAAGATSEGQRGRVLAAVRRGLAWRGEVGAPLFVHLMGGVSVGRRSAHSALDPVGWAIGLLGLEKVEGTISHDDVRRGFRDALRGAHPDHGADHGQASVRMDEIIEARRILLDD